MSPLLALLRGRLEAAISLGQAVDGIPDGGGSGLDDGGDDPLAGWGHEGSQAGREGVHFGAGFPMFDDGEAQSPDLQFLPDEL